MEETLDMINSVQTMFPKDKENESSRSVKICTRSTHIVIIFLLLLFLLIFAIAKTLSTTQIIEDLLVEKLRNTTLRKHFIEPEQ